MILDAIDERESSEGEICQGIPRNVAGKKEVKREGEASGLLRQEHSTAASPGDVKIIGYGCHGTGTVPARRHNHKCSDSSYAPHG